MVPLPSNTTVTTTLTQCPSSQCHRTLLFLLAHQPASLCFSRGKLSEDKGGNILGRLETVNFPAQSFYTSLCLTTLNKSQDPLA